MHKLNVIYNGWGRWLMDRRFRKAGRDPATVSVLERLTFIGNRALGALSFEPAAGRALSTQDVSLPDLAQRIDHLTAGASAAVLNELLLIGGSPQGARPKALVRYARGSGRMSAGEARSDAIDFLRMTRLMTNDMREVQKAFERCGWRPRGGLTPPRRNAASSACARWRRAWNNARPLCRYAKPRCAPL